MERKSVNKPSRHTEKNEFEENNVITVADLDQFRNELLKEINYLLYQKHTVLEKQWLKSGEVRQLLKISPGTLQHLRDTGQIPFTRLGGIIYYEHETIREILARR